MKKEETTIIIPAYREEKNIQKVIRGIITYTSSPILISIVLQDRNDPTGDVIRKLQIRYKNIQILYTTDGRGMLKALKKGLSQAKTEFVIITMADLSDDPRDIDKMIQKMKEGYDIVCASRYMKGGKHMGGPYVKGLLSQFGCLSLHFISGIPTHDATNAYKCVKRSILKKVSLESEEGFSLPLELTVKAYKMGFSIAEIPTTWKDRVSGESKFSVLKNLKHYLRWYFYTLKPSLQ